MAELPRFTLDAHGQTVMVYPDGRVVPVLGQGVDDAAMATGSGGTVAPAPTPITQGPDANAGYAPVGGYASGYARDYTPRPPSFDDSGGALPAYADGSDRASRLSAFGGGSAGGPDTREQIYGPSGQAAGPFETSAAPNPSNHAYGGSAVGSGGGGGGGGGGGSDLYWRMRGRLTGKLMGGGSSYSSGSYSSGYSQPKEPKEPKMNGPYAKKLDPEQAMGLAFRPTAMIPAVAPGLASATPAYEQLANLPAYELSILGKRGYKGTPKDLANSVGRFYENALYNNDLPDFDTVFKNLSKPKAGKGLDQMFSGVKNPADIRKATGYEYEYGKEPLDAASAAGTYEGLLGAALSLLPAATAAKYASYGSGLIDKATLKQMKKPIGKKSTSINKFVGRRLFK